jgi:hypothetical protein
LSNYRESGISDTRKKLGILHVELTCHPESRSSVVIVRKNSSMEPGFGFVGVWASVGIRFIRGLCRGRRNGMLRRARRRRRGRRVVARVGLRCMCEVWSNKVNSADRGAGSDFEVAEVISTSGSLRLSCCPSNG